MIELGSYQSLDSFGSVKTPKGYNVLALNSGRACIFHCLALLGVRKVILPYYYCREVISYLECRNIDVDYYHIWKDLLPLDIEQERDKEATALVLVNYFGLVNKKQLQSYARGWKNVIIDNCLSFFSKPIMGVYNVYSPRKFIGVSDGGLIISNNNLTLGYDYETDFSSDRSMFLLQRIEHGCQYCYQLRLESENNIRESGPKYMSGLTKHILRGAPYKEIKRRRIENYNNALSLFSDINEMTFPLPDGNVPFAFPFYVSDSGLRDYLVSSNVFVPHLWPCDESIANEIEVRMSKHLVLLPIDQRINIDDIVYMRRLVGNYLQS